LLAAESGEAIGKLQGDGWLVLFADEPIEPFREVLAEASPIRVRHAVCLCTSRRDSQSIRPHQSPFISIGALPDYVARRSLAWHTEG
jgi:hypothetical protein